MTAAAATRRKLRRHREMRRLLFDELAHWPHTDAKGLAADRYRAVIRTHYHNRTAGAEPEKHGDHLFRATSGGTRPRAGKIPSRAASHPAWMVPPWYFELWEAPDEAMVLANRNHPNSAAFRENFSLVHSILDQTMKTIRITLRKEGASATCTHRYRNDDFPAETTWAGDAGAFKTPDGRRPGFKDGLSRLESTVAHQARLCGATFEIEDLGGEARTWTDRVEP